MPSHQQRHDPGARRETLKKRQLHFEGMFAYVCRIVLSNDRSVVDQPGRTLFVNGRDPEWRLKPAGPIEGYAV